MMGIKSVAKFVENEFQGYYFSKPQPLEHWKNSL